MGILVALQIFRPLTIGIWHLLINILTKRKIYSDFWSNPVITWIFLIKSYYFTKDVVLNDSVLLRFPIKSFHVLKICYNFLKSTVHQKGVDVCQISLGILIVLQISKPLTIRPSYFSNQSLTNLKIYEDVLSNPIILLIFFFNKSYYFIQISY